VKVERLHLKNFRNVADCTLEPGPHLNFITGANGQGKTSFLEALGFLATLRSFRGSKAAEVIQHGLSEAEIICQITSEEKQAAAEAWRTELKINFRMVDASANKATKIAAINGKPYRSSTQYLCQRFGSFELGFHTVIFNPSDHDLIRGEPAIRRTYLDRVLSANDEEYLKLFQKYQRVLEQRNALLKTSDRPNHNLLMGFTEPLAKYAACLTAKRLGWIANVAKTIDNTAHQISPMGAQVELIYLSNWVEKIPGLSIGYTDFRPLHFTGHPGLPSLELLEQTFRNKASTLESAEWKAGHTLVGPHRDDWAFFLGGQLLKGHGSQGEVRSTLLALKISEIELFRSVTGHRPLFLLDDFSSELDQERRRFLLRFLSETDLQVFITTTEETLAEGIRFRISNGQAELLSDQVK